MTLLVALVCGAARLCSRFVVWWWRRTYVAWWRAWREPARGLRLSYLGVGLLISWALVPSAFNELGVMGGTSYAFTLFMALSNGTFFRAVRVGYAEYVPLGAVAPVAILVGVIGSRAMRPLLGDAGSAVVAGDLVGSVLLLGAFVDFSLMFREWQSGNPYGSSPPPRRHRRR